MALKWGNTTISYYDTNVTFNGNTVTKIYYNGDLVWEKMILCPICSGDGELDSNCYYCKGSGECNNCDGRGYDDNIMCTYCRGYDVMWYCTSCGNQIYPRSFVVNGIVREEGVSYRCSKCKLYYSSMNNVNARCDSEACNMCAGGYIEGPCPECNGMGSCRECDGAGILTEICPTCNGSGVISGSSTSD